MSTSIPTAAEVRDQLSRLSHAQMQSLARISGVPFPTLWKLRSGETPNPRIETVRLCYGALPELAEKAV